jgi:cobaltochelatase CobS
MSELRIDAEARGRLRSAITSAAGWPDYKRATGKGIAEFTKDDYLTACAALGLDAAAIINQTGEETMKERTKDRADVNALRERLEVSRPLLSLDSATKAFAIMSTIDAKQGGMATDAQFAAIERAIATAGAAVPVPAVPVPVPVPAVTAALDPAGKALADMVAPHIAQGVMGAVMQAVETRLQSVSTIRIDMAREGVIVGKAEGHHHPLFSVLCKMLSSRLVDGYAPNVWISGPAGSGKTRAVKNFAEAAGLPFYFNGAIGMAHELLGFIDAGGTYHRTPFREAYEHGGVYLGDEVDGSDNAALLALNAALANGVATFPDRQIVRHKDCIIVATANTWGHGSQDYVGRARIDQAFVDRFGGRLFWGYDTALETAIAGNPDFARRVQAARERARAAGIKVVISPRASAAGSAFIAMGFTSDEAADLTYLANLSQDQRKIIEGR